MNYKINNIKDIFEIRPEHIDDFLSDLKKYHSIIQESKIKISKTYVFEFVPDGKNQVVIEDIRTGTKYTGD